MRRDLTRAAIVLGSRRCNLSLTPARCPGKTDSNVTSIQIPKFSVAPRQNRFEQLWLKHLKSYCVLFRIECPSEKKLNP
jgi:hypothetical protein